ncbi:MAG: TIGR02996 domain-containing protein [Planctomycetes bacterium]|nr:TIGR02996 domain-containing protein [Planctomycetota bacterium]
MSEERALLSAIWEHPHEDTPRLVYADWLQEAGEPANVARAEFIRLQCEQFRLDEEDPRHGELDKQTAKLLRYHRKEWVTALPPLLTRARFVRGFIYPRLRGIRANQFLALGPADLAPAPLWSFKIESGAKVWPAVADSPNLQRLDHLDLGNNLLDEAAAVRLLSSEHVTNVSVLGLGLSRFTPAALAALAANDRLTNLTELTFWANRMTDETFAPLAGSARLATVRALNLSQNELTAATMRALAGSPHAAGLRSLDLFGNRLGDDGVRELCRSALNLRVLNLHATGMTDACAEEFANWPGLRSVRYLTLGATPLTTATARAFTASPYFRDDVVIAFWHTRIRSDSAAANALRERVKNVTFW